MDNRKESFGSLDKSAKNKTGFALTTEMVDELNINSPQILDVIALVIDAGFAEQSGADGLLRIEQVEEGIGILIKRRRVHDDLVMFGHLNEEFVDTRPLHDVDEVDHILNLDGDDKISPRNGPEAGMHQSLVQVQHQTLLPQIVGMVRRQQLHLILRRGILVQDLLLRFAGGVLGPLAVLVVVGRRIARDGGRPAGAEGGGAGRRGAADGLGGRRRAGVLGDEAAAHHPEGFQEGIAGVDVDPALPLLGRPTDALLLVGTTTLDLVRVELVPGIVHGLAVRRDVYVRLGTRRVLLPGTGDGIGTPGRGGVPVLVRLGDKVGDGHGLPALILGGGRSGRRGSDGGLIVDVDGSAAPAGGDGSLLDAWTAQIASATDSGGSLGLVVHCRLVRGGSGGIRPRGAPRRGLAVVAAAAAVGGGGTGAGMMALVVLGVDGPGIDVGPTATETAEADPTRALLGRFGGVGIAAAAVGGGHLGNCALGEAHAATCLLLRSDDIVDRNDSVRGIDRGRADVLGLLLIAAAAAVAAAAPNESKAATAGFGIRLGQTLSGGSCSLRCSRGCSDPPLRRRRRWMDLLRGAAAGRPATAAAAAPLDRDGGGGGMDLLRLLLVQRQSPPVLVAQSRSSTTAAAAAAREFARFGNAPGTVAEPRLPRLGLLLRLPLLEEVLLGTTTWRLSDRLLLWNGCGRPGNAMQCNY